MTGTMSELTTGPGEHKWSIELTDDLRAPGWIPIPEGLTGPGQQHWVDQTSELLSDLIGSPRWDGGASTLADIQDLLRMALEERAESNAYALFQVWPVMSAAATICRLDVVSTPTLPNWEQWDGVIHTADAQHIGPGLQLSTRRELAFEHGAIEVNSVSYVFSGLEVTVLITLEDCIPQLAAWAARGLTLLKDTIRVVRDDGMVLESTLPAGVVQDEGWPAEALGRGR